MFTFFSSPSRWVQRRRRRRATVSLHLWFAPSRRDEPKSTQRSRRSRERRRGGQRSSSASCSRKSLNCRGETLSWRSWRTVRIICTSYRLTLNCGFSIFNKGFGQISKKLVKPTSFVLQPVPVFFLNHNKDISGGDQTLNICSCMLKKYFTAGRVVFS